MAIAADPLTSLLVIISISGALATVLRRAGFNTLIGYIIGGILGSLIGAPVEVAPLIAQLGLILLGFEIGAEIGGRKAMGSFRQALVIEIISMSLIYLLTGLISSALRLGSIGHMVMFLIALNTSTGILYRAIYGRVSEDVRSVLLSASVIEDTVAVSGIALLPIVAREASTALDMLISTGYMALLALIAFLGGSHLFRVFGKRLSDVEMLPIIALTTALTYYVVFGLVGVSQLLGTFIAGFALARAVDLGRAIGQLGGLRELGLLLYFSSLGGTLSQLGFGGETLLLPIIAAVISSVVIIKFTSFSTALWVMGLDPRESIRVSLYMIPISEFGIIVSSQAYALNLHGSSQLLLLSVYLVLTSALISSLAVRFEEGLVKAIYTLIPQRVEEVARQYLARVRYMIASRAQRLTVFLYSFVLMVFGAVFADILAGLLRYLPPVLLQYGLILFIITSSAVIFSVPYIAWRSYNRRLDRDIGLKIYAIERIIGLNMALLLLVFGIFLIVYIVNKVYIEYQAEVAESFQGHMLFTAASIPAIAYILGRIYRAAAEYTSRRQPT